MSTITREFTKEQLQQIIETDHVQCGEASALARIAMASLEAEPVAYMNRFTGRVFTLEEQPGADTDAQVYMPVYTTPPAPVSVPEWTNEQCLEFLSIAFRHAEIKGDLELDDIRLGVKMVNGSRAAMLQGADGNSPVIPDGWVACSERMPDGMQTVITSNGFDIGQGWWDGEGWNSFDSHDVVPGEVTHWMPLPAAPQQEVKP